MSDIYSIDDSDFDDLLNAPVKPELQAAPLAAGFEENCPKCRGTGSFVSYSGRTVGQCFHCKGKGKLVFKTSPDQRAQTRAKAAQRKQRDAQDSLADFAAQNPAAWAWIEESRATFGFAASMYEAIQKYGRLTDNQLAACERAVAKRLAAKEAQAARVTNAPAADTAGIDRLKTAFETASAYIVAKGLKLNNPKITVGGFTISPAKAASKNPGALYVKASGQYLGKIADGKFFATRQCDADTSAKVLSFVADPAHAAKVYGQETGTCCICNATLKSEWRHRGIGPICAEKFGW